MISDAKRQFQLKEDTADSQTQQNWLPQVELDFESETFVEASFITLSIE